MPWLRRSVGDRSSKRQHFAHHIGYRIPFHFAGDQQAANSASRAGTSVAALLRLVCVGRSQAGLLTYIGYEVQQAIQMVLRTNEDASAAVRPG
jgi:hypothetical protein